MTGDDKDDDLLRPITDADMEDVVGGRPGGKPTTATGTMLNTDVISGITDGVNNDTLFAGPGDDEVSKFNIGMPPSTTKR